MLTAYDALTARVLDEAGIPLLLVGDSVGNNVLGYDTTIPVTMEEALVFTAVAARGPQRPGRGRPAVRCLPGVGRPGHDQRRPAGQGGGQRRQAGGRAPLGQGGPADDRGRIPVMATSATPQSANAFGRKVVRGRGQEGDELLADALALQEAGCFAIVLEAVPAELGTRITEAVEVATIGIGAGPGTDGQVLVITDLLGLTPDLTPRFVKRYADLRSLITEAAGRFGYVAEATTGPEHQYH